MVDHEVCYGALYDAAAKVIGKPRSSDLSGTESTESFTTFCLRPEGEHFMLYSDIGTEFAVLDTRTGSQLNALRNTSMVRFEAIVQSSTFTKRQKRGQSKSQTFSLSVNLLGMKSTAKAVGCQLSELSAYLQHPRSLQPGIEYLNPQFLTFADENVNMNELIGIGNKCHWNSTNKISEEIGNIFESLGNVTVEENSVSLEGLISALKKHHEDGLRFILQREDEEFGKQLSARLSRVVDVQVDMYQSMALGGLVADVMGLGKTLTMLSAILHSVPNAEIFANFHESFKNESIKMSRTKATLVVVSSAQLLESWESEIGAHFAPGALKSIRFHGNGRPRDLEILRSVDLVLTTYATLAAEQKGQDILRQVEWYRLVLDEAHWIRNSGSKQFQAAASLHTKRRWCLTGTPIQNKLEDLMSLAQFLQLPLVSDKPAFQKHILGPLSGGGPNFAKPLRTYLEAYCLRRSERCLTLPTSWQKCVPLQLSPEEQHLYNTLVNDTKRQVDSLVSNGDKIKCNTLFIAMIKMRMLCNQGTFSAVEESAASPGQLHTETRCERCSAMDEDNLILLDSCAFCPDCGRPLQIASPSSYSAGSQRSGTNNNDDTSTSDPNENLQILAGGTSHVGPSGFSTKLSAVVQNVIHSGPEAKSIIFSYWTTTLDILSQLLRQAGIPYYQVDGRVNYADRSTRLKNFKEDPQVRVLLMSIETGAVGLNLTVANQVHIVEPQWNPSVEEQAVARALRMGQTREVTIIRYVMEKTVEQNIVNLQLRKKKLAKFTFDTGTEENVSGTIEDLRFVLDIGSK
ncbi:SNF2 family N-terminal domain-containing protein [Hypoxylon cercidicola]|nr:SNF2 family N-terminal domain-containing protein [Hypoxylon cercidicola]